MLHFNGLSVEVRTVDAFVKDGRDFSIDDDILLMVFAEEASRIEKVVLLDVFAEGDGEASRVDVVLLDERLEEDRGRSVTEEASLLDVSLKEVVVKGPVWDVWLEVMIFVVDFVLLIESLADGTLLEESLDSMLPNDSFAAVLVDCLVEVLLDACSEDVALDI